jgi:hypothetical protein
MAHADAGAAVALRRGSPIIGAATHLAALVRSLPGQPWSLLGPLVLVQWAAVAAFALTVRHNGWLYYQGGDESAYYTSAWSLSQGHLPVTAIGWGWSTLLAPIALFAGSNFLHALPAIVVLQTVVLLPIALVSVYAIGCRLGGRLLGYGAAGLWIGAPFVLILAADPRYHDRYVEQFLPQALGLTGLADFPSMVALLAAAALILRALDERGATNAVLAGLVTGFAIGVKPANAIFLLGAALAFLCARRLRDGLVFGLALLPALVALAVWKQRGLGTMPLFALGPHVLAAGGLSLPEPPSLLASLGGHYVEVDWHRIDQNLVALREFFWNTRLLQLLPLFGLVAVLRRSLPAAALLGGWFAAFFVIKGSNQYATIDSGSFFRFLMPALPAYFLLAVAIPLLVPVLGGRSARAGARTRSLLQFRRPRLVVAVTAFVLAVAPALLFLAAPQLPERQAAKYFQNGTYVPVGGRLAVTTAVTPDLAVRLAWPAVGQSGVSVLYRVLRTDADPLSCSPVAGGTPDCAFSQEMTVVALTRSPTFTDEPGVGRWWYTVGMVANWLDDETKGDMLLASRPVSVDVG